MTDVGVDYFIRKAREERELAGSSICPSAAKSHIALAEQYDKVVAAYQPIIDRTIGAFH